LDCWTVGRLDGWTVGLLDFAVEFVSETF
jgi:hypothetical protein